MTCPGNFFSIPIEPRLLALGALSLDTVAWWPGLGERSLGTTEVALRDVVEHGRIELRTPLDAYVELTWEAADDASGWVRRSWDGARRQGWA